MHLTQRTVPIVILSTDTNAEEVNILSLINAVNMLASSLHTYVVNFRFPVKILYVILIFSTRAVC